MTGESARHRATVCAVCVTASTALLDWSLVTSYNIWNNHSTKLPLLRSSLPPRHYNDQL